MRSVRLAAVACVAAVGLLLAGCSSDDGSSASDVSTTSPTPSDTAGTTTSASPSDDDDGGEVADVGDFADVDGFTLVALPAAMRQAFGSAVKGAPQLKGFEGRLVEKNGDQVGMVIRISVDQSVAELPNFEDQFLPGFASGIAGTSAKPDFEEIDGVNVVKIDTPDGSGTAYAWVEDSVATVLVFKDAADAQTYAEGALD